MNREIKFRAWDKWKKVFLPTDVYAIITNDFNALGVMIKDWEDYREGKYLYEDSQSIMQFTGLHDKNGKEIYNKDIVSVTNKGIYNGYKVVVWDEILLCYVLVWADSFSEWKNSQAGTTFLKVSSGIKCEIAGNIYEHPELLTK